METNKEMSPANGAASERHLPRSTSSIGKGARSTTQKARPSSEMAGKAGIEIRAKEIGVELDGKATGEVIDILKRLEHDGYQFEVADASLELLLRGAAGWTQDFFELESFRVTTQLIIREER